MITDIWRRMSFPSTGGLVFLLQSLSGCESCHQQHAPAVPPPNISVQPLPRSHDSIRLQALEIPPITDTVGGIPYLESDALNGIPLPEVDTISITEVPFRAALRNGELWIADTLGQLILQLSNTDGNIRKMIPSPNYHYVACLKFYEMVESMGEFDSTETIPEEPVFHVMVFDLLSKAFVCELRPTFDPFISLRKWASNSRLIVGYSDDFAYNETCVYHASRNILQRVAYAYHGDETTASDN